MALTTGDRLGPHEILAPLGAGGMGEVYRARDSKLGRDVALKVLSPALAGDAQYMERFQREAKVLASLNHPNIAAIYGLEENALIMELVEGQTLEGPLPLETALGYARQITEALDYAHGKGVIHRDLKPTNVKVTPDGVVKLLDFGLAKVAEETVASGNPDHSPTLTLGAATRVGAIMGTAAYMAPEQARGQAVDKRADIWAFGVVLYEMLTGTRLFHGETVGDTLAEVLKKEIDFEAASAEVRPLLRRCLERDRKKRLRDIGDAWEVAVPDSAPVVVQPKRDWRWVAVAAVAILGFLTIAAIHFLETPAELPVLTMSINPPEKAVFDEMAISPDGKLLAFTAATEGKRQLWVRPLHALTAQPLARTEQAEYPFWSPDNRWIGFFADGKLMKIEAAGGPTQKLCEVRGPRGGSWNAEGVILYSDVYTGLWRVPAQGGDPVLVRARGKGVAKWPVFLPGGDRYLYHIEFSPDRGHEGIYLAALGSAENTKLVGDRYNPGYTEGPAGEGYLLFVRQGTLMANRFDAVRGKVDSEAFAVAEQVSVKPPLWAAFSLSGNGMLVYKSGSGLRPSQLSWLDRTGKILEAVGELASGDAPALSPDEKQMAVPTGGDIWVRDLVRGISTRFTVHAGLDRGPIWSPDGGRIVFASSRAGNFDLYVKSADGAGQEELLLRTHYHKRPTDWSADGRLLLYTELDPKTRSDIWALPAGGEEKGERKPVSVLRTEFNEDEGAFSVDGKWIAYASDQSGRYEIYVQPYPATGAKRQVSKDGGRHPRWRRDGREIYWLDDDGTLVAAEVSTSPSFQPGAPRPLFETGITTVTGREGFAVSRDGKRFLVPMRVGLDEAPSPLTLVQNWLAGAKR